MNPDQTILFVAQAQMVLKGTTAILKKTEQTMPTGFVQKKVVVSTSKMYIFESPHTDSASTEFRIKKQKQFLKLGKDKVKKQFYSVTGTPLKTIELAGKVCKANINPDQKFLKYLKEKLPIFHEKQIIRNVGILSDSKSKKNDLVFFHTPEATIRFAKAFQAVKAWNIYLEACRQNKIPFNIQWAIFLQDFVYKDSCIFVIDPLHYHDGIDQDKEMNCFCILVDSLLGISGLEFKFLIKDDYGYQCCDKYMKVILTLKFMRILIFSKCEIIDFGLTKILSNSQSLTGLTTLNLSHNKLTDLSLETIQQLLIKGEYLKYIDLSNNQISFSIGESIYSMLKHAKQELVLNFSYNMINDNSIDNIQNNILIPINPPIQEINISFNKFTKDGEWRLFAMNMEMEPYHSRMTFIIYPVPFHVDIFKNLPFTKWPVQSKQDYFSNLFLNNSMTSSKASSINGRSIFSINQSEILRKIPSSNNSRREETEISRPKIGIKIFRSTASDKQPAKTQELDEITRVKNELVIMVESKNVPLQTFYNQAKQISSYSFSFPTIALQPISAWLGEKMNEALRIRDHQSIDLIFQSCQMLGVSLNVYKQRLERVERRKELFCYRLYNLFNFNMNEMQLIPELQELIKQSLRLCLKGTAIDLLYYIKYLKDQKIKTFIKNQYSPYVELQDRRTQSYAKLFQNAVEVRQQIPIGLRKMTHIDVNLYDYYLYVNYFLLAMISSDDYDKLVVILRQLSSTHPEYSKFINQAFQRINFILTQFYKSFIYSVFSISYFELKINSCRMVWQYNNIKKSVLYSDLPNFPKKTPITPEKYIKIYSEEDFLNKHSILKNYDNIKMEVRERGIMGYKSVYTRYMGKLFQEEVKKLCQQIVKLFEAISTDVMNTVHDDVVKLLIQLIQFIRGCTHVRQLLQQLYLHVICFDIQDKRLLIKIVPIMTMYLRPPAAIQNYLIAFLLKHKYNFDTLPLSVEFQKNPLNKFVDRDWLPTHQQMKQLIRSNGKVNIPIRTTEGKIRFMIQIFQSKTVGDLMKQVYQHPVLAEYPDKATFWIYKHNLTTHTEEIILYDDYVGELISSYRQDREQFIVRRRIYSPFYVINFHKYTDSILNSIYHEVKHFYLLGVAYIVFDDSETSLGAIITIIDVLEEAIKNSREITFEEKDFKLFTEGLREKIAQILPISTRNQRSFKITSAVAEIKDKIDTEFKNPQNLTIQKLQRRFLDEFRNSHYYCSSNYQAYLYEQSEKCLVSINTQYISIETITDQKNIFYESLLSLCPDENFLNIYYYDKQKLETVEVVLEIKARISLAIVMDVLSYCVMRLYTSNMYIYLQRQLHETLFKYDYPISAFDPDKQQRGEEAIMASLKHRRGQSNASRKQTITNLNHIVGRLRTMELGIYKETDFIFQQEMKFSKWQLNREVFPFRSERLLPKSQMVRKSDLRQQDESNYEGSVTNKEKDVDDLDSVNIPKLENDSIEEVPNEDIESPLFPPKMKPEVIDKLDIDKDQEFNVYEVKPSEPNMRKSKKSQVNKVEVPKLDIPKRTDNVPKVTVPLQRPPSAEKLRPVDVPPLRPKQVEKQKIVEPMRNSIPREKIEVPPPKPVVEVPKPVIPPVVPPIVAPVAITTVPTIPEEPVVSQPVYVPPPVVPAPVIPVPEPASSLKPPPEEQTVTVIKPRNSNKMYDRTSRRRPG